MRVLASSKPSLITQQLKVVLREGGRPGEREGGDGRVRKKRRRGGGKDYMEGEKIKEGGKTSKRVWGSYSKWTTVERRGACPQEGVLLGVVVSGNELGIGC